MSKPDEALMWARESAYQRALEMLDGDEVEALAQLDSEDAGYVIEWLADTYRAGQAASAERIKALEETGDLLAWLAEHPELELSWGDVGDVSECLWRVHVRHGGINDREWRLVDVGHTPTEAMRNARALLKEADQ